MATLYIGYKAADIERRMLGDGTAFHVLDIYHRHAIEKAFHGEAKTVCTAHLPPTPSAAGLAVGEDRWDRVVFRTGPKLMSGELTLDLFQECLKIVKKGQTRFDNFTLEYVGRERDRNELVDKVKARIDRSFKAEWPASVPGGGKLMFTSYPGCFCHRRLDEGGLALAEVVCRELRERITNSKSQITEAGGMRLIDMGCGCGLVGLLIADFLRNPNTKYASTPSPAPCLCDSVLKTSESNHRSSTINLHTVLIDSHTRAVEAATENAAKFGIDAEVILADNGCPKRMDGTFDLFVGNPPYYSDYRIADVFLETAQRALKPGGVCYTVCKNAAGLEPVQKRYFPETEILRRRNYAVLKSQKVV